MSSRPEFLDVEVGTATLGVLSWTGLLGAPTVLAIPGGPNSAWWWDPVVHRLAGAAHVLGVDLRGRGRSLDQPGPFGIRQHADDVARVIEWLDVGPVVVAGYSTGAVVALMTAERHPEAVADVVLVDGGTPNGFELGEDAEPSAVDTVLDEVMGPQLEHLRTVWPDRVSYLTQVSQSPAFVDGIGPDLERNLLAELIEVDGGFRLAVDTDAVLADARDLITDDQIATLLQRRTTPTTIIRAEIGPLGEPPGVITPEMRDRFPIHRWIEASGLNHSTIMTSTAGAHVVAETLRSKLVTPPS